MERWDNDSVAISGGEFFLMLLCDSKFENLMEQDSISSRDWLENLLKIAKPTIDIEIVSLSDMQHLIVLTL